MSAVASTPFRSQHGEDEILAREFAGRGTGIFAEVGSYNGESFSNTYYLEKTLGWTGVLVEADPKLHMEGAAIRPRSVNVNCAAVAPSHSPTVTFEIVEGCRWVSSVSVSKSMMQRIEDVPTKVTRVTVPARTLDTILEEAGIKSEIDFVSVDVEGFEWAVLQGFTIDRWRPKVVIIERNSHFPERPIMRYMHQHGYGWRRTTGCNDWFYASEATRPGYRARLASRYYAPKYMSVWKPAIAAPLKRHGKSVLRKCGLLDTMRSLMKK